MDTRAHKEIQVALLLWLAKQQFMENLHTKVHEV